MVKPKSQNLMNRKLMITTQLMPDYHVPVARSVLAS